MTLNCLIFYIWTNIVWGGAGTSHLSKLVLLQKRAVRIMSGSHYLAHTRPLFAELRVLTLHSIHIFITAQFMYRFKNYLLPTSCMHLVALAPSFRTHDTRRTHHFTPSNCRTIMRQRSIGYSGPVIWDMIPANIQSAYSIGVFTNNLRLFLISS